MVLRMSGRMSFITVSALTIVGLLYTLSPIHAAEGWIEDFEAAKALAVKEKKDLLVDFTGSDWCIWCQKLDMEVFDTPTFHEQAPKSFILVKLDFPRQKKQSPEIVRQNRALQAKYQVGGFPSILLMDAQGKAFAKTGYQPGGADAYLKHLQLLLKGKEELVTIQNKLVGTDGIAKAKLLDRLVQYQTTHGLPNNPEYLKAICALDADGKAGLKAKYEGLVFLMDLESRLQTAARSQNLDAIMKLLEEGLAHAALTAEHKQILTFRKGAVLLQQSKFDDALLAMKEARKLAPESNLGKQIPAFIPQIEAERDKAKAAK